MLVNYISIIEGHYKAAKEHVENYNLKHTPTIFQATILTIKDIIRYKHIQIGKSYLVYDKFKINTLGITGCRIIRIYVPKEKRGNGIASKLKNKIKSDFVLEEMTDAEVTENKYTRVASTYVVRKNI